MTSAFEGAGGARGFARRVALACCAIVASLAGCGAGEGPGGVATYVPAQAGAYVDYEFTTGGVTSTCRIEVTARSGTLLIQRTSYSSTPLTDAYGWYLGIGEGLFGAASLTCPSDGSPCTSATSFSPPFPLLPASTSPGVTETASTVSLGSNSYASTRIVTIGGMESVTVPAGTFSALKVTARIVANGSESYNVAWWVRGIGRVKIANYKALDQLPTSTFLMTAHGVEPLAANPAPVSLALDAGQQIVATVGATGAIPTQTITGVATGDLASLSGAAIYVMIEDPSGLVGTNSISASADGSFTLTLQGRPLPTPGHFTGTLKLHAFLDPGGQRPFGGSPLLVPYDVTVMP